MADGGNIRIFLNVFRIRKLENMVITALKRPGFYTENCHHKGNIKMAGEQRNTEIKKGNYNENIAGNYNYQTKN